MHTPATIGHIHDILGKIKSGENVDKKELTSSLYEVMKDKANYGVWIKKVQNEKEFYISIVLIWLTADGEKKISGYRIQKKHFSKI
jgi:hypothetical protein